MLRVAYTQQGQLKSCSFKMMNGNRTTILETTTLRYDRH